MTLITSEVALIFRVTPKTIREWALIGKLPFTRIGKEYLFDRDAIEAIRKGEASYSPRSLKIEKKLENYRKSKSPPDRRDLWL